MQRAMDDVHSAGQRWCIAYEADMMWDIQAITFDAIMAQGRYATSDTHRSRDLARKMLFGASLRAYGWHCGVAR